MRSYYVSRPSQNRSPPDGWAEKFAVQAVCLFPVNGLFLTMVSGMCGLRGRNLMHKENEKWL
ncbi:MAG: hypothetical protein IPL78_16330 [Chloroflexi bacterium]|nr:hypothetical protein [Chloroflexota bacterium]